MHAPAYAVAMREHAAERLHAVAATVEDHHGITTHVGDGSPAGVLHRLAEAVIGLALGILVGVATDLPLAPEVGVVVGALLGWFSRRVRA